MSLAMQILAVARCEVFRGHGVHLAFPFIAGRAVVAWTVHQHKWGSRPLDPCASGSLYFGEEAPMNYTLS